MTEPFHAILIVFALVFSCLAVGAWWITPETSYSRTRFIGAALACYFLSMVIPKGW